MKADPTTTNRANMKRRTTTVAAATSLALLASSCSALSGGHSIAIATVGIRSSRSGGGPLQNNSHRRSSAAAPRIHAHSALHYRDGDEDQSVDMRAANKSAVAKATTETTAVARGAAPTTTTSGGTPHPLVPHFKLFTFKSPPPPSKEDEEQTLVDEYIEYYERRYSRMHPRQQRQVNRPHHGHRGNGGSVSFRMRPLLDLEFPRKVFLSGMSLRFRLHGQSPPSLAATTAEERGRRRSSIRSAREEGRASSSDEVEDHLNALGLSNLASPRLRQRLHVPREWRDEVSFITSVRLRHNAAGLGVVPSATPESAGGCAVGGRTLSHASSLLPTAQWSLLLSTLQRFTLAFANTLGLLTGFSKRVLSSVILDGGGFRNSVKMMSVASVAIVLMFRPLFRGMLRQG